MHRLDCKCSFLRQRTHFLKGHFFCTEAGFQLVLGQGLEGSQELGSRGVGSSLPPGNRWGGNHSASYQPTFKASVDCGPVLATSPHCCTICSSPV